MQKEVIDNVLQRRDTLAVMPTGSGKSLCYQLPALLFPGLTVVVSPLISLMQDQVEQLRELGIAAVALNSTLSYQEYVQTTAQIKAGLVKLLYVAPETLLRPESLVLLHGCQVNCLTIDEAHCISEWGHDFRPEYRQLIHVRRRLPEAVCISLTATATQRVRQDIKSSLAIANAGEFIASFNRDNLFLAVEPKTAGLDQTLTFLETHRDQSGIIYCATRRQVDELAVELSRRGWPVLPYHAGLDDEKRHHHQRQFSHDKVPIIVATIAFGMGINKSNVRFVLHYDLPKNLESYYQEIGRAGRDGLPADCLLLFSYRDVQTIDWFIRQQDPAQRQGAKRRLQALLRFVKSNLCRRRPLLAYFGEAYAAESCHMCDNCAVAKQDLLPRLSQQRAMTQNVEHGRLKHMEKSRRTSHQDEPVLIPPARPPVHVARPQDYPVHIPALFDLLRTKRKALAEANNIPPYTIFSDKSLVEMATYFPQSPATFATMYGVGEAKLAKYANHFLPVIQEYCRANHIPEKPKPAETIAASGEATSRSKNVNDLIQHVVALGKTGDRTNSTELINALEHPNGNVRRLAASALGKLRDKRAVPALLALLTKENKPQVRQYAVKALGRIRDGRAYAALQQIAQDDTERYSTRRTAIAALRRLRK
jgi:RecQ family ATP-dependent DNA helicase